MITSNLKKRIMIYSIAGIELQLAVGFNTAEVKRRGTWQKILISYGN